MIVSTACIIKSRNTIYSERIDRIIKSYVDTDGFGLCLDYKSWLSKKRDVHSNMHNNIKKKILKADTDDGWSVWNETKYCILIYLWFSKDYNVAWIWSRSTHNGYHKYIKLAQQW